MQQKSPLRAGQPKMRNARTQNDDRASAESSETDESNNDDYDSDATDSGGEDDSSDVILALNNSDEEDANDRPNATSSGRAINRRSEIDFSSLLSGAYEQEHATQLYFCYGVFIDRFIFRWNLL